MAAGQTARAQTARGARNAVPALVVPEVAKIARTASSCANCPKPRTGLLFCGETCATAFKWRCSKRGYRLVAPQMAARAMRDGTRGDKATGGWASTIANRLMQEWAEEDKAAGRMPMVEYYARRIALGLAEQ